MSEEKLQFQAEVSRLLEIVAGALYSNKEIFLRELISNASDACDRLRYLSLTEPKLLAEDSDLAIEIEVDKAAGSLTVRDNGIGMNREDLVENLGTIARSGAKAFMEGLEQAKKQGGEAAVTLIGQFGVGFYSAFMVADRVVVESRRAGEAQGWRWESDGKGSFTVGESDTARLRGTAITLHLKAEEKEYLEPQRIERLVRAYSDHIAAPIRLIEGGEKRQLNSASALWTRPKADISDDQYREFYHHVAHAFDEPWMRLHFQVEGLLSYSGLLFVPGQRPFDLFHPERRQHVKLYVKRVFITEDNEDLLPGYLRFLRGVVDCEDLPLNISREMLQHSPVLAKIRGGLTKRVLDALAEKADSDPEGYGRFWENFGPVLKEGLYEDPERREALLRLARFRSTEGEGWSSLAEVKERMKEGQKAFYFIAGDSAEAMRRSPQIEGFRAKGVEVLLMTDPVDEFWIPAVGEVLGLPFKSVTRAGAELSEIAGGETEEKSGAETPEGFDRLIAVLKTTLTDAVKDVRASQRLESSAVCLVADEGDLDMHLERLLRQHKQLDETSKRILEVNPRHPTVARLAERVAASENGSDDELEDAAWLLLDQALILEGEPLPDPAAFARRLSAAIARGLG